MTQDTDLILELDVSPFRRLVGAGLVAGSGAVLTWQAFSAPPNGLILQLIIWALAALLLLSGLRLYKETGLSVRLYSDRLEDSSGEIITPLAEIARTERGMLAFRPSNGFLLILKSEASPRWRMGLWWRAGLRAGVGGALSARDTRKLADAIEQAIGQSVLS